MLGDHSCSSDHLRLAPPLKDLLAKKDRVRLALRPKLYFHSADSLIISEDEDGSGSPPQAAYSSTKAICSRPSCIHLPLLPSASIYKTVQLLVNILGPLYTSDTTLEI